ncbi:MAG TPA: EamA family transporter [Planctomycetota bacterium]|nr:EamA family transporter [Planctomycetota bacterium]
MARARWLPFAAFVACGLIWGSTWLAIKAGDDEGLQPLTAASLRFAIAAAVLFGVQAALRIPLPRDRATWLLCAFVGLVLFTIDYGLIYWAGHWLPSGLTSVLFAVVPLFTSLLAAAYGIERVTARKLAGIALAIGGVAILSLDSIATDRPWLLPALGVVTAALCSGASTVAVKRHGHDLHPVQLNASAMAIGAAGLAAGAWARGERLELPRTTVGWVAVLYLALGGSIAAFLLYFWLLRRWDATHASFVGLVTPLLAVVLGYAVRGERVDAHLGLGAVLVLGGVYVGSRAPLPFLSSRRSETT